MITNQAVSLAAFLTDSRARVDAALEGFLPAPPVCPPLLSDAMRYSLLGGGKRLRPILVLAAADALGRRVASSADTTALALPAACAVEYIHTYSLIHDDLPAMDNDSLRRGRPTLHTVYGDAVAILAGDGLQAEAFALIATEPRSADAEIVRRKIETTRVIAAGAGACGMVGGQMVDIQAAGQVPGHSLTLSADALRAMHLMKTGALIRAAAVAGAIMAGGDPSQVAAIDRWATEVGLAFQIVDDILDVEGSEGALGKTAGKDAASAKPTYTSLFGLEQAKVMATDCASRAHQVLVDAHLTDSWLDGIADWVIARRN